MCGIAGIYQFNKSFSQTEPLKEMLRQIKHRGPDDEGVFTEEQVGLGFVRLSIIDLSSSGHQPKLSADENYIIVFNGEIFNYLELKEELIKEGVQFKTKTDTEVLLNSYIQWGEKCLDKFNGMWAFAVYNRQSKTLFAARDRYGVKPFYYYQSNEQFVFCSEIPPLLSFLPKPIEANQQAIFDYLIFNRTDQNQDTFFKNIHKLQHGHCLSIVNNTVEIKQWYRIKDRIKNNPGFKDANECKEAFVNAVKLRMRSDVPIGVCLSGGIDSSAIASTIIKELNVNNLHTFSAVYQKNQYGDESEFINEFKVLTTNMHYVKPDAESLMQDLNDFVRTHAEPIPSTSPYAQYKVMQLAKGKVVVTLDGQGADEHLAGYHYFFGFYFKDLFRSFKWLKLSSELFYYTKIHKSLFGVKTFLFFLLPAGMRTKLRVNEKSYLHASFALQFSESNSIAGNLYASKSLQEALIDHFEYKLEHLLKWEDRNSMHFSLEARTPFLDYRLVEKSLATAASHKIKRGTTKYIFREAMNGLLPEKIRMRQDKIGFGTPQDEWFKEEPWKIFIENILNSKSFESRNIINIQKAKEQYAKHLKGEINIAKEIWKWIHLELWFREFIDTNNQST